MHARHSLGAGETEVNQPSFRGGTDVRAFLGARRTREPCGGCLFTSSVMLLDSKLDSDSHLTDSKTGYLVISGALLKASPL